MYFLLFLVAGCLAADSRKAAVADFHTKVGNNLEDNHVTISPRLIMIKDELFYQISLSD